MAKYALTESGKVIKEGQEVGSIDLATGAILLPADTAEAAKIQLKARAFDLIFKPKGKTLVEVFAAEKASPSLIGGAPLIEVLTEEQRNEFASVHPPPAPPQDPRLGDKTPAYMEWLGHYHPDEYKERYKGRKTHLNAGVQPKTGPLGDVPEDQFGRDPSEQWM